MKVNRRKIRCPELTLFVTLGPLASAGWLRKRKAPTMRTEIKTTSLRKFAILEIFGRKKLFDIN